MLIIITHASERQFNNLNNKIMKKRKKRQQQQQQLTFGVTRRIFSINARPKNPVPPVIKIFLLV